jgi:hypothetical protein
MDGNPLGDIVAMNRVFLVIKNGESVIAEERAGSRLRSRRWL